MIQSTSFCNLDCSYCYLPLRDDKSRFDLATIPVLLDKLAMAGLLDGQFTVSWHAGEPTVLPASWYREAMALFDAHLPAGVEARHSFQTNGVILSDDHARLFAERGALVGVSIDGPREIHDSRRTTRDGRGTFDRAMAGVAKLQAHSVPFSTISVLTEQSIEKPDLLYDFFQTIGSRSAGFNIEEIEGSNLQSSLSGVEMVGKARAFYRRMHERAAADPRPLRIRELDEGLGAAAGGLFARQGGSSENNPLSIISVDTRGRISTFSPELLQVPGDTEAYTFGDVASIDFTRLWQNNRFAAMHSEIQDGVAKCRAECRYFDSCHGGAPANKLAEHGTFVASETMHCRLTKQALIDVMEDVLAEKLQVRRAQRPTPASVLPASQRPPRVVRGGGGPAGRTVAGSEVLQKILGAAPPSASALFPHLGQINLIAPANRIRLSPGTIPASGDDYRPDALLPIEKWRSLEEYELDALRSSTRSPVATNFCALLRLPEHLVAMAQDAATGAAAQQRFADAVRAELQVELAERSPGVADQLAGARTSTFDPTDGKRIGLHVDSWSRSPVRARATAYNRLAINIGAAPRRFLMLDLGLEQIADVLGAPASEQDATAIARRFLRQHPNYPVLSLEVRPGEAYVAATENLVHDGTTFGRGGRDAILTLLGRFDRSAVAPYFLGAAAVTA